MSDITKWEYKVFSPEEKTEYNVTSVIFGIGKEELNKFGEEGWELVSVIKLSDNLLYFLKRKVA